MSIPGIEKHTALKMRSCQKKKKEEEAAARLTCFYRQLLSIDYRCQLVI